MISFLILDPLDSKGKGGMENGMDMRPGEPAYEHGANRPRRLLDFAFGRLVNQAQRSSRLFT